MESHAVLAGILTTDRLAKSLCEPGQWRPYPSSDDRAAWDAIDPTFREAVVNEAIAVSGQPWPELTASMYSRFTRDGNREQFEASYFTRRYRLAQAVLAAATTGDEQFLSQVVDGIWLLCEETTWVLPAHARSPLADPDAPMIDLFSAETGALLAYTDLIIGEWLDRTAPMVRRRLRHEVRTRILAPYHAIDEWWYGGFGAPVNNWNPWVHSNVLSVTLLLGADCNEIAGTVQKALVGLDNYVDSSPSDGGCDEGASYWWSAAACLFECMEILHSATAGQFDPFTLPLLRNMARYPLIAHIAGDWQVNFADGTARKRPESAAPWLLRRFGRAVGDSEVAAHAVAMGAGKVGLPQSAQCTLSRVLAGLFDKEWATASGEFPYLAQAWLPDTEIMTARENPGQSNGLFLAAKAGHNQESHNHNDIGSFIVAHNGIPVLIDVGVGTYTRETFSQDRYKIWTMRSIYHNVPTIGGFEQSPGSQHRAMNVSGELSADAATLSMDLTNAYPTDAGIQSWRRRLRLNRESTPASITIDDSWTLSQLSQLDLHLMSASEVDATKSGVLIIDEIEIHYDSDLFSPAVETIAVEDPRLTVVWGDSIWRVTLSATTPTREGVHRMTICEKSQ